MTNDQPTQPLTDAELALMERLWAPHQTYVRDLLDEVYRLRAENTVQAAKIAEAEYLADGWIRAGSGWSSLNMNQAVKYRALIDCGKALQRALGVGDSSDPSALDQSGEGQANG